MHMLLESLLSCKQRWHARILRCSLASLVALAASLAGCDDYPSEPHSGTSPKSVTPPQSGPSAAMGPIPADAPQTFTGTLEAINSAAPHPGAVFARLPTGFTVWYLVTGTGILDGEWEPHPSSVVFGSTGRT